MRAGAFSVHRFVFFLSLFFLHCCGGGSSSSLSEGVFGPLVAGAPHAFRGAGVIGEAKYLIGGPLAQGRVGDVLLQNDKIRVVIQKPRRNAGLALYGGNILDADLLRPAGEAGQDNFGITFPLLNVSYTPFYKKLEVLNSDFANGPVVVRATGVLNVYDYIQASVIVPFARIARGIDLFFPDQFNDVLNPFENMPALRNISRTVVTDYILRADRSYVIIQTHLLNTGSAPVPFPVGDWVNGSGNLEIFNPGLGFTGEGLSSGKLPAGIPGVLYPGMETNTKVSYGYFFDPAPFQKADGTFNATDLLTISGVSIMILGEKIAPGIIPLGSGTPPTINFSLPPGESTYVRYFAVGNGDAGSVFSSGLQALGIPSYPLAGRVVDRSGQGVALARVLVMDEAVKKPVTMFYSDENGNFSGLASTGADSKAQMFGSGRYRIEVYKEGYVDSSAVWPSGQEAYHPSLEGKKKAGNCRVTEGNEKIFCVLGESGLVEITAKDENGNAIPARVAVVGFDPSPYHALAKADDPQFTGDDHSIISDIQFQSQKYGYVDTLFLGPNGTITLPGNPRVAGPNTFRLEPGDYEIVITRGPEYSRFIQRVLVSEGHSASVNAVLRKVVDTSGYISGDFHIHGIRSPDSPFGEKARVHNALAEGLDLMISADHDAVTDYTQAIGELGVGEWVGGIPGNEITPNSFGHFIVFPLAFLPEDPMGGSFDYTKKEGFEPGPSHREVLSPGEILDRMDQESPGEQVLQAAHILDKLLGNFSISRLITTTKFEGIPALSSFTDPVQFRLPPNSNSGGAFGPPYPLGTSTLITDRFTALELCIGDAQLPLVFESSLPTWFNFLNLGKKATATCSSDSHGQMTSPLGNVRNFILSTVDPRDGRGRFSQVDPQEIARSVNAHHVVVTTGPFLRVQAASPGVSAQAGVGDTLTLPGPGAKEVILKIQVESPDWIDWDTVDVYVNADPTPAEDDLSGSWKGTAEEFVTISPTHLFPKYLYSPAVRYQRGGGAGALALPQEVEAGRRFASLEKTLTLAEDSWIVIFVRGSERAQSLFPLAASGVKTLPPELAPERFVETFHAQQATLSSSSPALDQIGGSKAFAFTNPIFVDIDGDGWQAKFVREGKSPFASP